MKLILKLILIGSPLFVHAQKPGTTSLYTVLTHVNVIDATGTPVQNDMTVVIKGNRIIDLEKTSKARVPKNAFIINASGKYLVPGLWDMHVHVFNNVSKAPPDTSDFSLYLANGVTGIREMWTQIDEMPRVNYWRKKLYEQPGTIPRIGAVGTMVDGLPSVWRNSETAITASEARVMVQRIKATGIDFVKTYNRLSRDAYFAITDEAAKLQIPVAGHIPNRILLKEAANAGQVSIEHLTGSRIIFDEDCTTFTESTKKELPDSISVGSPWVPLMEQVLELCDEKKAIALFQYLAEKNIWQCPTTVLYKRSSIDSAIFFSDFRLKYIASKDRKDWEASPEMKIYTRQNKDGSRAHFQNVLTQIRLMKKAGIRFLAGTDFDNPFLYPGFSLHDELAIFVEAGFTPMEALQTATLNPAKFLGTIDSLGSIEKGKIADMVLLDANPLENIRNTQLIQSVFINGKYLPKEILREMLLKVEEEVKRK